MRKEGIEYQRIRVATPRHNGIGAGRNGIDDTHFYDKLKMYCIEYGQKQLAVYQRKSNNYWKICIDMRSPNDVLASFDTQQKNRQ